jgi:hypothetical protein
VLNGAVASERRTKMSYKSKKKERERHIAYVKSLGFDPKSNLTSSIEKLTKFGGRPINKQANMGRKK